jgi:hypothetical protein
MLHFRSSPKGIRIGAYSNVIFSGLRATILRDTDQTAASTHAHARMGTLRFSRRDCRHGVGMYCSRHAFGRCQAVIHKVRVGDLSITQQSTGGGVYCVARPPTQPPGPMRDAGTQRSEQN